MRSTTRPLLRRRREAEAAAGARAPRLRNLRANPRAALVVDDYDEDWTRLAYVLVRGPARLLEEAAAHAGALRLLRARYPQYVRMALDDPAAHPVVRIQPARIVVWRAAG